MIAWNRSQQCSYQHCKIGFKWSRWQLDDQPGALSKSSTFLNCNKRDIIECLIRLDSTWYVGKVKVSQRGLDQRDENNKIAKLKEAEYVQGWLEKKDLEETIAVLKYLKGFHGDEKWDRTRKERMFTQHIWHIRNLRGLSSLISVVPFR